MERFRIKLTKLEKNGKVSACAGNFVACCSARNRKVRMEFHIDNGVRQEYGLNDSLFSLTGNVVLADMKQARDLTVKFNSKQDPAHPEKFIKAGQLYAMGLIDEILHYVLAIYREQVQSDVFEMALGRLETNLGAKHTNNLLTSFSGQFPPRPVYKGEKNVDDYLKGTEEGESCRALSVEETLLLSLANLNPAFRPFKFLFDDKNLSSNTKYPAAIQELKTYFKGLPYIGPDGMNLWDFLRSPAKASPDSLLGQLEYMRKNWGLLISRYMSRLLLSLDVIKEEDKPIFFGPGPSHVMTFAGLDEYERFSPDQDWMPNTVLMAKSSLVWLFQLTQKYGREITRLDQIPDEEIDELSRRGFTGLWLIGIWERSQASKMIKQWTGNPEAAASAYSLYDYDIAAELGGWGALCNLRERCIKRGIRLGSDMVPNHTGLDSRWMIENPDRFLQLSYPPFPTYNYNCGNLSGRDDITVQIEEHYFSRSDAAVVFKRVDNRTGETRYIYHGNDGTSMPWNDTAQIDFLNPEAREAVIRTIIGVCQQFSIVRFDAAMTLAKRHIQRLWFPAPGTGGAIASRAEQAITTEEFNRRIPNEFWREVVDRCAAEAPNTLLLAEAFWMMEGYFVRTLGMHRVYNSAFMNMLKNEENEKYRATIKNTMEFDPEILKRFVNFMNNPDEDTAVMQFGKGDKYFGICTLLVTMPGLPMFGHGQIEGFEEKYGMEYRRSYRDEQPDGYLVDRHEREIFPLMKRRNLFSGSAGFRIYDLYCEGGSVNENVFAYSNRVVINGIEEKALIFYNNSYYETAGWIRMSDPAIPVSGGREGETRKDSLSEALAIHDESRYFLMLREQKTNLWFIRSSKEICESGFFVGLKGYETQVYLDIYEVEDDAKGRWARLNNDLKGRGVPNPLYAVKDIFLGELYYRFGEFFKPEIVEKLSKMSGKHFSTALFNEIAGEFITTASLFISGADGLYDPWIAVNEKGVPCKFTEVDYDVIIEWFNAFLGRVAQFNDSLKSYNKASSLLVKISDHVSKGQLLYAVILGFGLISLLRFIIGEEAENCHAADLAFKHWDLGRKLKEVFYRFGASEHEAAVIADITEVLIKRMPSEQSDDDYKWTGSAAGFASLVIEKNYQEEDFRRVLGINVFDDVIWFNKEGFEDALFYASLFFMVEGAGSFAASGADERIRRIAEIYDVLCKAEKKSEYRFDKLLDNLTLKPKVETKKAAAKPSVKKAVPIKPVPVVAKKETAKPSAKKPAAKKAVVVAKPSPKKIATKKVEPKKPTPKKTAAKPSVKKPVPKKPAPAAVKKTKPTAKKPATKKAAVAVKKAVKPSPKKTATKKIAVKKTTAKPKPKAGAKKTIAKAKTRKK